MKRKKIMRSLNVIFTLLLMVNLFTPIAGAAPIKGQTSDDWITVEDAIELGNDESEQTVKGYIVGFVEGPGNVSRDNFPEDHNVALASNPGETDTENMLFVQLQDDARDEFGLKTNPENLDEEILASGKLESYFNHNGLKGVKEAEFVPEEEDYITVEEALEIGSDNSTQTVRGHIVGEPTGKNAVNRDDFRNDHAVALADNPGETDPDMMIFVQLPNEQNFRTDFGLKSNPGNLDEEVFATGALEQYHQRDGIKQLSDMRFTDDEGGIDPDPGEPLEIIPIADAREQSTGEVMVQGIVTGKLKNTIHIQDETGGIAVRPTSLNVQLGDEVVLQGSLLDYFTLLQIDGAEIVEKVGTPGVPEALIVEGDELTYENQSKLATAQKVTIVDGFDGGEWSNYDVVDEKGNEFMIRDEKNDLDLTVGTTYDAITGIITHYNGDGQIIPRNKADILVDETVVQAVYATPDVETVPSGTEVTLATNTEDAEIYYTLDGSEPTEENGTLYTEPIVLETNVTIKAFAMKEGLTSSGVSEFDYVVYDAEDGIQIHDIQGEGHISPMVGQFVEDVEGIVTYKYDIRGSHYFHIQAKEEHYDGNPNTSEAIVVYTGREENVEISDYVGITGTVDEYHIDGYDDKDKTDLSVTQINARDDRGGVIDVKETGVELPEPVQITSSDIPADIIGEDGFDVFEPENYAIDFWESLEAMRVEIAPSKAVAPQEHGDLVVVTEEYETNTNNGGILLTEDGPNAQTIQFKLYPNSDARDLAVKTGDQFTEAITGVVNYGFSNYKVYADLEDIEEALEEVDRETRTTNIVKDDDKLTVAAYNVENFSANTSDRETPVEKAKNIARAFVEDMESPDIIGVVEVQDNNGQDQGPDDADASESYERLIRVIEEAGGPTYDYANIDPEYNADGGAPHGNIRVGFLYNPERVSMIEAEHGTATDAVGYENGELTLNPGRIDPNHEALESTRKPLAAQFEFNGESIVVVANHFNSKLGDYPYFGQVQPPILGSVEQRKEIAALVNGFVKDIMADNPEENVVVLGDMNDFEFSEALDVLKGDELTNMIESVPAADRYTYVYQGNSQVLDHALVSNHLAEKAEIDILHVNADLTDMHGRASDHDPILTQLDLRKDEVEPEPYNLFLDASPTEETSDPVTITVDSDSESDLVSVKWLEGERTEEDFADEGHEIDLETLAFEVEENGVYTVFSVNEEGVTAIEQITIDNIVDPDDGDDGDNGEDPGDGDDGDNGDTPGDGDGGDNGDTPGDGNDNDDGKDLPKTATNMYNILFVGLILLVFGGIIIQAHRRHTA